MRSIGRTESYNSSPEEVFQCLDDLGVTGMHMTRSSPMMFGTKLHLQFLTDNHKGPGTKYRWTGKMMGVRMDSTVEVTRWLPGEEKIWETVGKTRLIIYSWFRMHLKLKKVSEDNTLANLVISYKRPEGTFYKVLSLLFADWYCKWCLRHILKDCKAKMKNYGT